MSAKKTKYASLMARAQERWQDEDYQGAAELFRRAVAADLKSAEAHYHLGLACFVLDEQDEAAEHLRAAGRWDSLHAASFTALGALLLRMQRYDDAVETLRRSLQANPSGAEAYFNLGSAYARLQQPVLAVQAYQECVRLNPNRAVAHKNLAHQLVKLGRLKPALEHYRTALALRPHLEGARLGLARAERLMAHKQSAERSEGDRPEADDDDAGTVALPPATTPEQREEVLDMLYELALHGERLAKEWHDLLSKELDAAFKELSQSFVDPEHARQDQRTLHRKFAEALARYRSLQAQLAANCRTIQQHARRLPVEAEHVDGE